MGIASGIGGIFFTPLFFVSAGTAATNFLSKMVTGKRVAKASEEFQACLDDFKESVARYQAMNETFDSDLRDVCSLLTLTQPAGLALSHVFEIAYSSLARA